MGRDKPTLDYANSQGEDVFEARRARIDRALVKIVMVITAAVIAVVVLLSL